LIGVFLLEHSYTKKWYQRGWLHAKQINSFAMFIGEFSATIFG